MVHVVSVWACQQPEVSSERALHSVSIQMKRIGVPQTGPETSNEAVLRFLTQKNCEIINTYSFKLLVLRYCYIAVMTNISLKGIIAAFENIFFHFIEIIW